MRRQTTGLKIQFLSLLNFWTLLKSPLRWLVEISVSAAWLSFSLLYQLSPNVAPDVLSSPFIRYGMMFAGSSSCAGLASSRAQRWPCCSIHCSRVGVVAAACSAHACVCSHLGGDARPLELGVVVALGCSQKGRQSLASASGCGSTHAGVYRCNFALIPHDQNTVE